MKPDKIIITSPDLLPSQEEIVYIGGGVIEIGGTFAKFLFENSYKARG